ncbi:MAG: glycine cleavage system protein GcvH [Candidatus Symbiodolus clandestinus]
MSNQTPENLYYTKNHEWLHPEANSCYRVGMTSQAQSLLGEVIFVDLPGLEEVLSAGENCAVTESEKAAVDVYAPISGKIIAINEALNGEPELINQDPYGKGWLFVIQASDKIELSQLLTASDYQTYQQELVDSE